MIPEFPNMDDDNKLVLASLLEVFYIQLKGLASYINADSNKVSDDSFAKFILFAMEERLNRDKENK